MKMSPRNIAMVAYEAQQQALTQLSGTVGLPWEQASAATKQTAHARVLQIISSSRSSVASNAGVPGTFNTVVATAGLTIATSPNVTVAAAAGDRLITIGAGTCTGTINPGDTISLTGVWSLVTTGSIQTSGSGNTINSPSILLKGTASMTGYIMPGETFTVSAQTYSCTQIAYASGNTCRVYVTPKLAATYSDATAVTLGNVTVTCDAFVVAAANAVTFPTRAPLPTVPATTVFGSYTAVGLVPGQAQAVFDQVVLSCLDSHGGDG